MLRPRSLYVMRFNDAMRLRLPYLHSGAARFDYKHAVLGTRSFDWHGAHLTKTRRVSLIFRDEQ